jgi:ankyrin repeat protein
MMDLYLQQGADINCLNCESGEQQTALFHALDSANYKLADWLIQRGANINIPANVQQATNVTAAMLAAIRTPPSLPRLDYLIKNGADLKSVDSMGRNALLYISNWGYIDTKYRTDDAKSVAFVDQLVNSGIDVNHQDRSGATALMNAANSASCSPGAIKLLLSYGADPAVKNKLGKSALDIAIDRATASREGDGCNEVVKILMNLQKVSRPPSIQPGVADNSTHANSEQQSVSQYAGTYTGAFSGTFTDGSGKHDLSLLFLAKILPDGSIKLFSDKGIDKGRGKIDRDGLVTITSPLTGIDFSGKIDQSGELNGTWKSQNNANVAGIFKSSKIAPMR